MARWDWRGPWLGPPFDGNIVLLKQRRNRNSWGGDSCLLASSSRMVIPLLTTTSRRSPPFTWCCISGKACRSSSRPSLARGPVLSQTTASPTSFPLEGPSHDKSPPRTTSLWLWLVRRPRGTTRVTLPMREEERISTSRGNNSWRPCWWPAPARALMQVWQAAEPSHHHHLQLCHTQDSTRGTQAPSTMRTSLDLGSGVAG
jgi:hypothetical protein